MECCMPCGAGSSCSKCWGVTGVVHHQMNMGLGAARRSYSQGSCTSIAHCQSQKGHFCHFQE